MALFRHLHEVRHLSLKVSTLSILIGVIAGFPKILEAIETNSEHKHQARSPTGKVAADKVGSARNSTVGGAPRAGKELFEKHCVTCHGLRGRGDGIEIARATVADLSSAETQRKLNVELELLATIHEGRPGKVMPAWNWRLSEQQSKDVLAYVRTLRK